MTGEQWAQLAFAILGVAALGIIACAYVSDRRPADERKVSAVALVGVFLAVSVVGSALSGLTIYLTP